MFPDTETGSLQARFQAAPVRVSYSWLSRHTSHFQRNAVPLFIFSKLNIKSNVWCFERLANKDKHKLKSKLYLKSHYPRIVSFSTLRYTVQPYITNGYI